MMFETKLIIPLVIILGVILAKWIFFKNNHSNNLNDSNKSNNSNNLNKTTECFVPYNSALIPNVKDSVMEKDKKFLEGAFSTMIAKDSGKFDLNAFGPFKEQLASTDQAKMYLNYILARINAATQRRWHILDIQAIGHSLSYDTKTFELADKWTAELFIQDTESREVHASATAINVEFYTFRNQLMVTKMYFTADFFNTTPAIDGINKYDLNFEIKNPFSLMQPFPTTNDKVLQNVNETDAILVRHHDVLRKPSYRCFQENGDSDNTITRNQCHVQYGRWDKPVEKDEECPFFMAQKHYPNKLGGVDKNSKQCEMPVGTKPVGYRFISNDPAHKPWCYNCHIGKDGMPGSIGPCCDEQRNMELYPELGGNPDYAFPGDPLERGQNWSLLAERGLNWMAHPTKTKDIVNPKQKQPIFNAFISP